jgi:hypothetical protein
MQQKVLKTLAFQIGAPPQGDSVILEVLDDKDDAFMDVRIDSHGIRFVTVYDLSQPVTIPLSELTRLIEVAEREVKNVDADSLFESKRS